MQSVTDPPQTVFNMKQNEELLLDLMTLSPTLGFFGIHGHKPSARCPSNSHLCLESMPPPSFRKSKIAWPSPVWTDCETRWRRTRRNPVFRSLNSRCNIWPQGTKPWREQLLRISSQLCPGPDASSTDADADGSTVVSTGQHLRRSNDKNLKTFCRRKAGSNDGVGATDKGPICG